MVWKHNNTTVIQVNKAWKADGYQHPANWHIWDDETKAKWSVTWTDDPKPKARPDDRFYWGYKVDADGNETDELNPKALADVEEKDADGNNKKDKDGNNIITLGLVSIWVAKKKFEAQSLLDTTDWYCCRKAEKNTEIPNLVIIKRDAIRVACDTIVGKINACDTLDKFIKLFETSLDSDGKVVKSDMDCY
jgi:hypothetical protein|tara:strand:+ start:1171 stop:1743 length:573 start_codon:yes stop_codon:yes gene_type:complete